MSERAGIYDIGRRQPAAACATVAAARSEAELVAALLAHARALSRADGIAIVRRDGERVRCIAEDAIGPLWTGQVFPIDGCLSGTALRQNRVLLVPDVEADLRVRLAPYAPTFVRGVAIFPIGAVRPRLAIGAYWAAPGPIDPQAVTLLTELAQAATRAAAMIEGGEPAVAWRRAVGFR